MFEVQLPRRSSTCKEAVSQELTSSLVTHSVPFGNREEAEPFPGVTSQLQPQHIDGRPLFVAAFTTLNIGRTGLLKRYILPI